MATESNKIVTVITVFENDVDMPLKREIDRICTVAKNVNSHLVILDENPRSDHRKPLKKGVYNPWSDESSTFESNPWTDVAHLGEPTAEV